MTAIYALLGVVLVIVAIPFGLMLAPLVLGAILLWAGLRRADRALQQPAGAAA
jgi:hypothetical protein